MAGNVVLWGAFDDPRPIVSVDVLDRRWRVGDGGVTVIEPYLERGQVDRVLWFAVFRGDEIECRVNSAAVEYICYCTN